MASAARLTNFRSYRFNSLSLTSNSKLHQTSPLWRCLSSYNTTIRIEKSTTTSKNDYYKSRNVTYSLNKNKFGLGSAWENNRACLQTTCNIVGIRNASTYDLDSGPVEASNMDVVSSSNEAAATVGAELAFGETAQGAVIDVAQTPVASGDNFATSYGVDKFPTIELESAETIGADFAFSDIAQVAVPDVAEIHVQSVTDHIDYIPAPPVPIDAPLVELTALGEPTLQSMGLASWWPSGWMQYLLENIHVGLDLPWWGTIALATVGIRCLLFPLVIKAQKNGAKMANYMPQLQILQMKITEARNSGNQLDAARLSHELANFYKEKDISIAKTVMVPLAQAPIFMSMFFGLRAMANFPVDSLKTGGMAWFTDLTVADPYIALPLICSATLLASIELGVDGSKLGAQSANVKLFLRALPFVMLPFTYSFPAAVLCYWVTTNSFSLVQVGFLKIPKVRDYFAIPITVKHEPGTLPPKKGMVEGFKDSWANQKIVKEIEERAHFDDMRFRRAGQGPIVKTYKHNPTVRNKNVIDVKPKFKK